MKQWLLHFNYNQSGSLFITSVCILFISLSWLISLIVFSSTKLKHWEGAKVFIHSDRMNRYLGVYIFSLLIINSPFKFLNLKVYLKNNSFREIIRVNGEIRKAEHSHIFAFLLVAIGSSIFLYFNARMAVFLSITFSNVLFNLYPVLSLQLQRSRISKMVGKENYPGKNRLISK